MRWRCGAAVGVVVVLGVAGCGGQGQRSPARSSTRSLAASNIAGVALSMWQGFRAEAEPRPVVVLRGGTLLGPKGGFPSLAVKAAFLKGRYVLKARLPAAPAVVDGYALRSAAAAYRAIDRPIPGHLARPHGPVTIQGVRLGTATFATDRGVRRLPAWLFFVAGVRHPIRLLALRPSQTFIAPTARILTRDTAPLPAPAATIGRDDRTLTVSFIGAAAGSAPCDAAYSLQALGDRQAVAVTVISHPVAAPADQICDAVGYPRRATIRLAAALGSRALIASKDGGVMAVVRQNTKRVTVSGPGEGSESAGLIRFCRLTTTGPPMCARDAPEVSRYQLPVRPGQPVILTTGAPAKSVSVRLAVISAHTRIRYLGGPRRAGELSADGWTIQLPPRLGPANVLAISVLYSSATAQFQAAIRRSAITRSR